MYLPISFDQVLVLVKQLSKQDQAKLITLIEEEQTDPILTHFASEQVLAKDWLSEEEDEAWKDL